MAVLAAWLSSKIDNPWLTALLGVVLIGVAVVDGIVLQNMSTLAVILLIIVGVINLLRLLPHSNEQAADQGRSARASSPRP
jgi:hypothetical protein